MPITFRIATANNNGGFLFIGDHAKVPEDLFWQILTDKVRQITKNQPDKYDEVLQRSKEAVKEKNLTIIDTWFEIKGKP